MVTAVRLSNLIDTLTCLINRICIITVFCNIYLHPQLMIQHGLRNHICQGNYLIRDRTVFLIIMIRNGEVVFHLFFRYSHWFLCIRVKRVLFIKNLHTAALRIQCSLMLFLIISCRYKQIWCKLFQTFCDQCTILICLAGLNQLIVFFAFFICLFLVYVYLCSYQFFLCRRFFFVCQLQIVQILYPVHLQINVYSRIFLEIKRFCIAY